MIKANYHTHTKLCNHATGNVSDYVKKAIDLGLVEIGMSDHNPVPRYFMNKDDYYDNWVQRNMQLDEFYDIYLKELDEAILLYGDKIKILKGLECEFIPQQLDYYKQLSKQLDYLNLGIHFFVNSNQQVVNSYSSIDYRNVVEYAKACVCAMQSGLFKILVHPDLFMFNYRSVNGKREFDEHCEIASRIIIEEAIKQNVYLEINANGLYNSIKFGNSKNWLYPNINFWQIVKEYPDALVIIGADAHRPEDIYSDNVEKVIEFANSLEIKIQDYIDFQQK